MQPSRILVVLGDKHWTSQAFHLACAMARNSNATVGLIRLIPVANPHQLGNINRHPRPDQEARLLLRDLMATAEDYAIELEIFQLHYTSYINGLSSAAGELMAAAMFAPAPKHRITILNQFQQWRMHRAVHCPLYTLDQGEKPRWAEFPRESDQPLEFPETPALSSR